MKSGKEIKLSKKCRRGLLQKPNVIGSGIGYREKEGKRTDEQAVVVFVSRKIPKNELRGEELIPRSMKGQPVDVVEIGEVRLLDEEEEESRIAVRPNSFPDRHSRCRPALGGVSISHYRITSGTLGAAVRDKSDGSRLILSNNHVLANTSSGGDGRASPGDAVLQPGSHDGGLMDRDLIALLERFIPMKRTFQASSCLTARFWESLGNKSLSVFFPNYRLTLQGKNERGNLVDAAVARPLNDADISDEILELGKVSGTGEANLGQDIVFSGRTSGVVRGQIIARNADLYITMGPGEQVYFTDQLITSAVSSPGDSGSLLLNNRNQALGLLFAGSDRVSICNRIDHVCRLLNIEFA